MTIPGLRIPRPRVETVRRHVPGQLSPHDYAIAATSTALIDALERMSQSGRCTDALGYELRHSIPFQLGGTAADAVLAPSRSGPAIDPATGWAAYRVDVAWTGVAGANQWLEARAEVEYCSPNLVRFAVETRSGGRVISGGKIHYVRVRAGVNLALDAESVREVNLDPTVPAEAPHAPWEGRYSPFLLRMLMSPAGGSQEPLGRRIHPAGSVPLAAALFQAMRMTPGRPVTAATMKYLRYFSLDAGFCAETKAAGEGQVAVTLVHAGGAVLARAHIEFDAD